MKLRSKVTLLATLLMLGSAQFVLAQPGRGGGGFFGGGSALGLLADEKVQDELEIVDEQSEKIQALQQEMRSEMGEMFNDIRGNMRDMDDSERQEAFSNIREKMTTMMKDYDNEVYKELLPHQTSRLKQLVVQSQGRRGGGLSGGQVPENLIDDLGITEEQLEAMKKKAEQVQADLVEKINKLRAQAENEILSVLDPGQKEKYKELIGEPFQFSENGGFGGGRGGRGGQDGGRRGGGDQGGGGDRGNRNDF